MPAEGHSISVKLSALHPRYEVAQYDRAVPSLIEQVEALATLAAQLGIPFTIDAEESERLEMSLDIIEAVAGLPSLKGWDGLGMAVQAYGKRARPTIAWADALGARTGRRIAVRLVKGAYWDTEIKRTQEQGVSTISPVHPQGGDRRRLPRRRRDMLKAQEHLSRLRHPQCAHRRHPARMGRRQPRLRVPAAARHGRGPVRALVRDQGYHTRIYAPVGGHRDLLAYLVRRLLENGANSSFVHQLADET